MFLRSDRASFQGVTQLLLLLALGCMTLIGGGCASVTFPVTGVPVYRVPPELLAESKDDKVPINLALLQQPEPDVYRLAPGDVLGVWVDGVFANRGQAPPSFRFNEPQLVQSTVGTQSAVGVPFPVLEDGTVDLPLIGPVKVNGLQLSEAKQQIRKAYIDRHLLKVEFASVFVTLARQRIQHVLVFRQEGQDAIVLDQLERRTNRLKRGTAHSIDLPAYKNDVLNALAYSGGLPGLEAYNAIFIQRARFNGPEERESVRRQIEAGEIPDNPDESIVRIPLRLQPGEPLPIRPQDVVLETGDVVFVEARVQDVYYTGGLLPAGEFVLPRDYDLDVVEAVSRVRGPLLSGGLIGGDFTIDGQMLTGAIGGPSPSMVIVLRRTPDGRQLPIRVDLDKAIRNPHERVLIMPNDVVLLQQTPAEAHARYLSNIFRLDFVWRVFTTRDASAVTNVAVP